MTHFNLYSLIFPVYCYRAIIFYYCENALSTVYVGGMLKLASGLSIYYGALVYFSTYKLT